MKFYETHYEEYTNSTNYHNIHSEIIKKMKKFPNTINNFGNLIVYGPQGSGKYTQVLNILRKYSNNDLKHDKKITCQTDKQQYTYHISDIHYEIDMSLLGCNSKILWHEIFFQIVDIISVKPEKAGIILCKNFHSIHPELLETFYSYMQHCNNYHSIDAKRSDNINKDTNNINKKCISNISCIQIHFIILTEHISFIPNNIVNSCYVINIAKPQKEEYAKIINSFIEKNDENIVVANNTERTFTQRITDIRKTRTTKNKIIETYKTIPNIHINNIKELNALSLVNTAEDLPKNVFNIICDNIINEIINYNKIVFTEFRDVIYDMLIYNLDIPDCLWYILNNLIKNKHLSSTDISSILKQTFIFIKYYNNNYRPIYHLESILFYIIIKVHKIDIKP